MAHFIIWILIWKVGIFISYSMMRVEHEAEGETYTKGDRIVCLVFSLLSFLMVLIILIKAWVNAISKTGYWKKPVKAPVKQKPE